MIDLPMHEARAVIAIELAQVALAYPLIEGQGSDMRGGNQKCIRLTARRVQCSWRIEAYLCDVDFTNCEEKPYAISKGSAWATKYTKGTVVTLGSTAKRR